MPSSLLSPPTRREVTISLVGLCVFVLAYNFNSSVNVIHPTTLSSPASSPSDPNAYIDSDLVLGADGRRPPGYRDALEETIFGKWEWPVDSIARGTGRKPQGEGDRYMEYAILGERLKAGLDRAKGHRGTVAEDEEYSKAGWGPASVDESILRWGDQPPPTKILKHIPGYTILENVYVFEGMMTIVTNNRMGIPPLSEISSSSTDLDAPPGDDDWAVMSTEAARDGFGEMGIVIGGTTWLATGPSSYQDSHTFLSLWRLHSTLDPSIAANGTTTLAPPLRLIFPHIPRYTSRNDDPHTETPPKRSYTSMHPLLPKAALPSLGLWHFEDWDDIVEMSVPFIIERLVFVDRGAASRAALVQSTLAAPPEWAGVFEQLEASEHWIAPLRHTMAGHLGVPAAAKPYDAAAKSGGWGRKTEDKPVVVYVSTQLDALGPKMREADHNQLVTALRKLGKDRHYEIHIVDARTPWGERMQAIIKATIVLGVTGESLADGYFMRSSPHATLMEFFPSSIYMRDLEIPMKSLNINYMAWWNDRSFTTQNLPKPNFPADYTSWSSQQVPVDAKAVVKAIHEELSRS